MQQILEALKYKILNTRIPYSIYQVGTFFDVSKELKQTAEQINFSEYEGALLVPIRLKGSSGYMSVTTSFKLMGNDNSTLVQCHTSMLKISSISLVGALLCPLPFVLVYHDWMWYILLAILMFVILCNYFIKQLSKSVNQLIKQIIVIDK